MGTRKFRLAVVMCAILPVVAACSGGGGSASGASNGTLTFGESVDPGSLNPLRNNSTPGIEVARLAYDPLIWVDPQGKLRPGVLTSWQQKTPLTWELTVRKGVTCSDGSAMDAQTVADNFTYDTAPKNKAVWTDLFPGGAASAVADTAAGTVTVKLKSPSPFLMQGLTLMPLVCEKGLKNPSLLANESIGSGPYVMQSVQPGNSITYTRRKGYTWGPSDYPSTAAAGLPAKVVVKIVTNATTMANLLLNGQVNIAGVTGNDQKRLQAQKLFSVGTDSITSQIWFNHSAGLNTADASVRQALTMGLDMGQIVPALTGGQGKPATGLQADPKVCSGNTLTGNLPSYNVAGAKALLKKSGWTAGSSGKLLKDGRQLKITFAYRSDSSPDASAAQVVASDWTKLGVDVTLRGIATQQLVSQTFAASLKWDAMLLGVGVSTPAQMTPFVSGAKVPEGQDFAFIDNPTYDELSAKASKEAGTAGCPAWNAAEEALYRSADIVPTGQLKGLTYGKGATVALSAPGPVIPTSFRLK